MSKGLLNKLRAVKFAGAFGGAGAFVAGGIALFCGGPVAFVAASAAVVLGVFGTAVSALNDGTNLRGDDYRESWAVGLPATAALAAGAYALFNLGAPPQNPPPPPPPASQSNSIMFNQASPASARDVPAAQWSQAPAQRMSLKA